MNPLFLGQRALGLARFASKLPGFLDKTISVEEAQERIREGVEGQEQRFLQKLQSAVYARTDSPYRKLFDAAGCGFEDVRELVRSAGLEGALETLATKGVYVSYEELKGRKAAVRGSRSFQFQPSDFDNPNGEAEIVSTSGGTTGRPTTSFGSLASIEAATDHWAAFFTANDCLDRPLLFWTPGHAGIVSRQLACAKFGRKYSRWFVSGEMTSAKDRIYAGLVRRLVARECGFAAPTAASYDQPEIVLDAILSYLSMGGACMNTAPSVAVKLSLAAQARDAPLEGLTFLLGAESLTPARRATIEASGARATPLYGSSEASWIGGQCSRPEHPDEVHVLLDNYAVIPDLERGSDADGRPLRITALQPLAQKVLINAELGDYAVIGRRRCDCLYDRCGCTMTLHTIRSSDKITEYGVNIAVSDVVRVLEEKLPARFGGATGDYQLLERRNADGLPRYTLVVSPDVAGADDRSLATAFLGELSRLQSYYGFMTKIFEQEKLLDVQRGAPQRTMQGKLLAFYRCTNER